MRNSQMELLYRETYIRAYRMRHPRCSKIKILSVIVSAVMILKLITTLTDVVGEVYPTDSNEAGYIQAYALDTVTPVTDTTTPSSPLEVEKDVQYDNLEVDDQVITSQEFTLFSASSREPQPVQVVESTLYDDDQVIPTAEDFESAYLDGEDLSGMSKNINVSGNSVTNQRAVLTEEELEFFERVVEAEVTGTTYKYDGEFVDETEMLISKVRVAQVFLNRVDDTDRFSHITTVYEAISEPNASSTVLSGRCYDVEVTDLTKEAVQIALNSNTKDYTDGALFFLANGAEECKYGSYLFTDDVGHSFFK